MKFSFLATAATCFAVFGATTSGADEIDFEFIDFLQSVEDCYRVADNMPQDTTEQIDRFLELALTCDEGVEQRSYTAIFREAKKLDEHLFMLELAVAALQETSIDGDEKVAMLNELVTKMGEINESLYIIGYLN